MPNRTRTRGFWKICESQLVEIAETLTDGASSGAWLALGPVDPMGLFYITARLETVPSWTGARKLTVNGTDLDVTKATWGDLVKFANRRLFRLAVTELSTGSCLLPAVD